MAERRSSAFTSSGTLEQNAVSKISMSKAFLKDYRKICQEITVVREDVPIERSEESTGQLHFLLERQRGRLRRGIHAMLDGEEYTPRDHHGDAAEKELWTRFGHTATTRLIKDNQWVNGGVWIRDTKNSEKALQRLVKYLPEED